jgi:hypothetical protein
MTGKREVFISVDIEAAGPVPPDFSMLSLGACLIENTQNGFYRLLRPISDRFVPKALEVTGFDLDTLRREGTDPALAMEEFRTWIDAVVGTNGKPVFVGFNAPFDWSFVNYYFHHFLGENPFGIGALDVKALYMGATGAAWAETRSSLFPVPKQPQDDKHNALADAQYQAGLFLYARGLSTTRGVAEE